MKKHKLLKHAYDKYPKGTRVKSLYNDFVSISSGVFVLSTNIWRDLNDCKNDFDVYDMASQRWAKIITEEKPKSILDGKVAVQVNNERERDKFNKHIKPDFDYAFDNYPAFIQIDEQGFYSTIRGAEKFGYTIVSFQDFAKEVGIEVPKLIMKSEDGVDLYEGNYYHRAYKSPSCANWNYNGFWKGLEADCYGIQKPEEFKIFSTKQAALKWIEKQNKPKSKTLPLYFGQEAIINLDKSEVRIMDGDKEVSTLSFGDINDLYVEVK